MVVICREESEGVDGFGIYRRFLTFLIIIVIIFDEVMEIGIITLGLLLFKADPLKMALS